MPCLFQSTLSDRIVDLSTATSMSAACGVTPGMRAHFDHSFGYTKGVKCEWTCNVTSCQSQYSSQLCHVNDACTSLSCNQRGFGFTFVATEFICEICWATALTFIICHIGAYGDRSTCCDSSSLVVQQRYKHGTMCFFIGQHWEDGVTWSRSGEVTSCSSKTQTSLWDTFWVFWTTWTPPTVKRRPRQKNRKMKKAKE